MAIKVDVRALFLRQLNGSVVLEHDVNPVGLDNNGCTPLVGTGDALPQYHPQLVCCCIIYSCSLSHLL